MADLLGATELSEAHTFSAFSRKENALFRSSTTDARYEAAQPQPLETKPLRRRGPRIGRCTTGSPCDAHHCCVTAGCVERKNTNSLTSTEGHSHPREPTGCASRPSTPPFMSLGTKRGAGGDLIGRRISSIFAKTYMDPQPLYYCSRCFTNASRIVGPPCVSRIQYLTLNVNQIRT